MPRVQKVTVELSRSTLSADDQAIGHSDSAYFGPPPSPHHAHYGLRAAALPAETELREAGHWEELHNSIMAGVAQAHDRREFPGKSAGTPNCENRNERINKTN